MTKAEAIARAWKMVEEEQFNEAFAFGYENGIELTDDWEEENGTEYYIVTVEDLVYRTIAE